MKLPVVAIRLIVQQQLDYQADATMVDAHWGGTA
jgi:hypothetical protein